MTTPHSADALNPCPFCGDEMKIDTGAAGFATGPGEVYVICDCGAMGAGGKNQDEAIAAWNRRPTPASDLCADLNAEHINTTPASPGLDNEAAARLRKQAEEAKKVRGVVALSPEDAFALLDRVEWAEAERNGFEREYLNAFDGMVEASEKLSRAEAAAGAVPEGIPLLTGYAMRHRTGSDIGFSWDKDDPQFGPMWERVPMTTAPRLPTNDEVYQEVCNERGTRAMYISPNAVNDVMAAVRRIMHE